jgi:hypothetical protein
MRLYLGLFQEGGTYLSTTPDGDANQPIELKTQVGEHLSHLLSLPSFIAVPALAVLYLCGASAALTARAGASRWLGTPLQ